MKEEIIKIREFPEYIEISKEYEERKGKSGYTSFTILKSNFKQLIDLLNKIKI